MFSKPKLELVSRYSVDADPEDTGPIGSNAGIFAKASPDHFPGIRLRMTREVFLLILATASEDPSVNCERLWYKILTASRASRTKVLVNGYSFCVRIRSANGLVCHDLAIRFYAGGHSGPSATIMFESQVAR